jgi:nuclear transport factor 2 (NTF2) superfamily protein
VIFAPLVKMSFASEHHTREKALFYWDFTDCICFLATKWQHNLNYCKSKELSDFLKV